MGGAGQGGAGQGGAGRGRAGWGGAEPVSRHAQTYYSHAQSFEVEAGITCQRLSGCMSKQLLSELALPSQLVLEGEHTC